MNTTVVLTLRGARIRPFHEALATFDNFERVVSVSVEKGEQEITIRTSVGTLQLLRFVLHAFSLAWTMSSSLETGEGPTGTLLINDKSYPIRGILDWAAIDYA